MKFGTLAFLLTVLGGSALADTQSCKNLRDRAPEILGDLNQVGSHEYENEHLDHGYSATFADPSSKVTVFFYDQQQKNISSEIALESFKQSARDIAAVAEQRGAEVGEINANQVRDASQVLSLRAEVEKSDGLSEFLAVGIVDNCIVKLRFTAQLEIDKAGICA